MSEASLHPGEGTASDGWSTWETTKERVTRMQTPACSHTADPPEAGEVTPPACAGAQPAPVPSGQLPEPSVRLLLTLWDLVGDVECETLDLDAQALQSGVHVKHHRRLCLVARRERLCQKQRPGLVALHRRG